MGHFCLRCVVHPVRKTRALKQRHEFLPVSPVKMLVSPLVPPAELDSCPSDTFILLQGFPTSASTENAWARELRPCILEKYPVFLLVLYPSALWFCAVQVSVSQLIQNRTGKNRQQQHLREPLFSHGASVTLRNWSGVFPCVLRDARLHPKSSIIGTPPVLTAIFTSHPLSVSMSPLSSVFHRELVPLAPLCASQREGRAWSAFLHMACAAKSIHPVISALNTYCFINSGILEWRTACSFPSGSDIWKETVWFHQQSNIITFLPKDIAFSSLPVLWNKRDTICISTVRWNLNQDTNDSKSI